MKKTALFLLVIAALAFAGCKEKPKTEAPQQPASMPAQGQGQMPPGHPGGAAPGADPHAGMKAQEIAAGTGKQGKVTQTMNSGGYTYVEATNDKGEKVWMAMPEFKVKVGDTIEYPDAQPMLNFPSKTLNRTFDKILFIQGIRIVK